MSQSLSSNVVIGTYTGTSTLAISDRNHHPYELDGKQVCIFVIGNKQDLLEYISSLTLGYDPYSSGSWSPNGTITTTLAVLQQPVYRQNDVTNFVDLTSMIRFREMRSITAFKAFIRNLQ